MTSPCKSVDLNTGVTLSYVEHGPPDGTPLLFLHGLANSWRSFERVIPFIPGSFRAIFVTLRGHRDSSTPRDGFEFHTCASDVLALMDALDVKMAVVIGHSWGSTIAQRFALEHPERTRGLVLLASFHNLSKSHVVRALLHSLSETNDEDLSGLARQFQESSIEGSVPAPFMETMVEDALTIPRQVWCEAASDIQKDDFSHRLSEIRSPTLLIWGGRDKTVHQSEQDAQCDEIPNASLKIYDHSGHSLHWEEPERLISDVVAFIQSLD